MRHVLDSPIGPLTLEVGDGALTAIRFGAEPDGTGAESGTDADHDVCRRATAELAEYFAGDRREFTVPLAPHGTDFQHRVWAELARIGYGETTSYGAIAARLGLTGHGARAVGLANGRNPLPVVVPCHRVVGADGRLVGYAGGIPAKTWLLDHEGAADLLPLGD